MLAPHHGKDAELGEVRLAPEDFLILLEFFRRKAVLFDQFGVTTGSACGVLLIVGLLCY
jgi:hypothetical protein